MFTMREFKVTDVIPGSETTYKNGVLTVNVEKLQQRLMQGTDQFESVEIAIGKPGEKRRIIHIIDAVEPRLKSNTESTTFPGFTGPPYSAGEGITYKLANVAILTCSRFSEYLYDSHMGSNECIVDMSGPGASFSPFASTFNIILNFKRSKIATTVGFATAMKAASFEASSHLTQTLKEATPEAETLYNLDANKSTDGLPKIAAVLLLASLGAATLPLRVFYVYGHPVDGMLPIVLHPNEVLDGAVVGVYCLYGGLRNPTYYYQNNPVIKELYREHGKTVNFVGVILSRSGDTQETGKLNKATRIAGLANLMHVDGAIVSANAHGHHVVDLMLACQKLENAGVKSVGIIGEMGNADGSDNGFPFTVPEANSLISTGNFEERISLPAMDEVNGGDTLQDGQPASAAVKVRLGDLFCSSSETGAWRVSAKTI